ncbi:MAG TPA: sugar phosphate isomerase/epimerase [Puia sp.]|nr:sugar phosphate isomerase/epimerase [Puia sp.]
MTSRRNFLKSGSLSLAALTIKSNRLFSGVAAPAYLGIQLYTVRDDMGKDPSGTLKELSKMGYRYVEHANYHDRKFYGYTPADFKKLLADYNMEMPSGHVVMTPKDYDFSRKAFADNWKYTVEDAAAVGQKYLVSPWLDESLRKNMSDFKAYMDVFNQSGALCKQHGMKFGYHNHDFEFSTRLDGKILYDLILENTDPELVAQQLDMGNLYNGGVKAIDIAKKYPGRFELMHVKDEIESSGGHEKYESTILGQGIVGTKAICDLGRKSGGTRYFIIEQESYQGKTPLDCSRLDYDIMKDWGY